MPIYTTKSSTIKYELLKHKLSSNASTHPAQDYFCTLHSSPVDGRDWHQVGLPTAIKHNYYYFFFNAACESNVYLEDFFFQEIQVILK